MSMLIRDEKIERALQECYAGAIEASPYELDRGRVIIFSDQHRGIRNGADDFAPAEPAYRAALDHYFAQGHMLVSLGDAEELWEERPSDVVSAYAETLASEARFHKAGRYLRLWGNHDDEWRHPSSVARHLSPVYGAGLTVPNSVRMPVVDRGRALGELFLTHGHQGTGSSDRFAGLSRMIVRYIWRPLQRLTKYSFNTPSQDFSLREHHDQTMYAWAASRPRTILIVGHTHRPVFKSQRHSTQLREAISELEKQLKERGDDLELLQQINALRLRLEQVLKQDGQSPDREDPVLGKPCYFNSGCCCYPDGDITGIELNANEIRLVRWSPTPDKPMKVLARTQLSALFEALG